MTIHADDALADAIRQSAQELRRKTPDFLLNLPTISQEGYDELMSVQKDFEAIDAP